MYQLYHLEEHDCPQQLTSPQSFSHTKDMGKNA